MLDGVKNTGLLDSVEVFDGAKAEATAAEVGAATEGSAYVDDDDGGGGK